MENNNFENTSYAAHEKFYSGPGNPLTRIENTETINYWRHQRMYSMFEPLVNKNDKWLTVGDGIGTDANWLMKQGTDVMASDIADNALKMSLEKGHIKKYQKENAERLSFEDNAFDFVLCKEAYHHFPRPYLGIYEMVRVAKKGVVLIEPLDIGIQMPYIIWLKNILDRFDTKLIDKIWKNRYSFETIGNYVYKISEREIEKAAMGLNLPAISFRGFNDYYSTKLDLGQPTTNKSIFNKVKSKISRRNLLCKLGLIPYSLSVTVIFTSKPSAEMIKTLNQNDFKYIELPENPYL